MKKFVSILLVLVLALSLCGCDSLDYQKAMRAYEAGDYGLAHGMFAALGDYKDSANMTLVCGYQQAIVYLNAGDYAQAGALLAQLGDYKDSASLLQKSEYALALQYMKAGNYADARTLFLKLGNYEDSAANAVKAARYMVIDYVAAQGGIDQTGGGTSVTLQAQNDTLAMGYAINVSGVIGIELNVAAILDPETDTVLIQGTDSTVGDAASYEASASKRWDIATYGRGAYLRWEQFSVSGTTDNGQPYPQSVTLLNRIITTAMDHATALLEQTLAESGLGLTMADLGFTNFE